MKKLTGPQRTLLTSIMDQSRSIVSYYKPAIVLVREGLARWGDDRRLHVTPAGQAEWLRLAEEDRSKP